MTAHPRWLSTPGCPPPATPRRLLRPGAHLPPRRPGLRLTVWRAVRALLIHNPVMAAKYQGMTRAADAQVASAPADAGSRQVSAAAAAARTRRAKARVACAASLLRWIYSMVVHDTRWDSAVASGAACQHASLPPATSSRPPDQPRVPHPPGCPRPSSPMSGKSQPAFPPRTTSRQTLGSTVRRRLGHAALLFGDRRTGRSL